MSNKFVNEHSKFFSCELQVGGLGDVAKALPEALGRLGHRVMTVAPRYACYPEVADTGISFPVELPPNILRAQGYSWATARLYRALDKFGVERIFIDHPIYEPELNLPPHMVYGAGYLNGDEHSDLDLRYSILCQGALAAPVLLWDDLPDAQGPLHIPGSQSTPGPIRASSMIRREAAGAQPSADVAEERRKMLEQLELLSVAVLKDSSPLATRKGASGSSPLPTRAAAATSTPEMQRRGYLASSQDGSTTSPTRVVNPSTAVTFVANDWATSLVALRLKHSVQSGYMRQRYTSSLQKPAALNTTPLSPAPDSGHDGWQPPAPHSTYDSHSPQQVMHDAQTTTLSASESASRERCVPLDFDFFPSLYALSLYHTQLPCPPLGSLLSYLTTRPPPLSLYESQ